MILKVVDFLSSCMKYFPLKSFVQTEFPPEPSSKMQNSAFGKQKMIIFFSRSFFLAQQTDILLLNIVDSIFQWKSISEGARKYAGEENNGPTVDGRDCKPR